jgi:type I restriction enzyme R subunit
MKNIIIVYLANLTIDCTVRDGVRTKVRLKIRSLLKRYKYPPDQQKDAIDLVLRQAEVIPEDVVYA